MQTTTAAYGTIVGGNDITYAVRVTITWPAAVPAAYADASLVVSALRLDRSLTTDMPLATRLVTGYPAAQLDMTLAGLVDQTDETKTIAWLMGQYRSTSPLFRSDARGLPIVADVGMITGTAGTSPPFEGVEFVRIFTGVIDSYTCDEQVGTVVVTSLDYRAKLTTTPGMPNSFDDGTSASLGPMYGQFPMDLILHTAGVLSRPVARPGCVLMAGMRQGAAAEIGTQLSYLYPAVSPQQAWPPWHGGGSTVNAPSGFPFYVAGSPGGAAGTGSATYTAASGGVPANSPLFIEGWFTVATGKDTLLGPIGRRTYTVALYDAVSSLNGVDLHLGTQSGTDSIIVNFLAAGVSTALVIPLSTPLVSDSTASYLAAQITWTGTAASVSVRYRGQTYTGSTTVGARVATAWAYANIGGNPFGFAVVAAPATAYPAIDSVQITTEAAGSSTWNDTFTPTAVLDMSLNNFVAIPDVAGTDAWNTIQGIVEAEGGIGGFDELGVFRFRNRRNIQASQPVRTIDADHGLIGLTVATSFVDYVNHVQVPVNALKIGPFAWVWTPSDVPFVPAHGTWVQFVTTDNPVVALATTDSGLLTAGAVPDGTTRWRAARNPDGTGGAVTNGISVAVVQLGPAQIKVTVTNVHSYGVYLCSPTGAGYPATSDGQPALNLGGKFVLALAVAGDSTTNTAQVSTSYIADAQWPPLIPDGGATANPRGEHLLVLPTNNWRQSIVDSGVLVADLLSDLCSRRPTWIARIVYDPRLQLADRVIITDTDVTGLSVEHAILTGIRPDLTTFTADVDLRPVGAPGGWMLNQVGRSELNSTIYI